MPTKLLNINPKIAFVIYAFADLLCTAMGMGVPFFCILLGFPVGWYVTRRELTTQKSTQQILKTTFIYALITVLVTFLIMTVIWGITAMMLFNPEADFENFGIPLILYDPKVSFIGWLVLMIVISPFLQLLTTIFASYLTLLCSKRRSKQSAMLKT